MFKLVVPISANRFPNFCGLYTLYIYKESKIYIMYQYFFTKIEILIRIAVDLRF